MITRFLLLLCLGAAALSAANQSAPSGFDARAFSPEDWPGELPVERKRALREPMAAFVQAMRGNDLAALGRAREELIAAFGPFAGVPEERPKYGQPVDPTPPSFDQVARIWLASLGEVRGRFGWEEARRLEQSPGAGGKVPRLRVSERQIRALLQTHEAGLDPAGEWLALARTGLDYLLTTQAASGIFGYPYDPQGGGLRPAAAAVVERGRKAGRTMVEREWVIDDLGDGGLNFDNGTCGAVLLHGYALTGDKRYLGSAERAGRWALGRTLVPNFNYNGFSGVLMARLYRATGNPEWLEGARRVFEFGVLSGQMANGRWIDPHNAKIQYHAILCAQATEYWLALQHAGDAAAARVAGHVRRGLDNLAAELAQFGTNNAHEALSLQAFALGQLALGPNDAWTKAAAVAVNYVTGPFIPIARQHGVGLPEPIATWLLQQAVHFRGRHAVELRSPLQPTARPAAP